MPDNRGDDEAMRAIQRKAQEALRKQEEEERRKKDFNRRREEQLINERLIREASEAIKRANKNPTPRNIKKADEAKRAANRGTGGLCLPILVLGAAGLGILTVLISQLIRVIA